MLVPATYGVIGGCEHPPYGYALSAAPLVPILSLWPGGREFTSAVKINDERREMLILNGAASSDFSRLSVVGQGSRCLRDKCRGSHHGVVAERRVNRPAKLPLLDLPPPLWYHFVKPQVKRQIKPLPGNRPNFALTFQLPWLRLD